jgi:hypothetical protein
MVDLITPPPTLVDDFPHGDEGHDEHHGPTGILKWMTSTDHKVIGLSYTVTSVVMLIIGGLFAEIIRAQLASPNGTLVSLAQYNELFTMHGSVMIYLFAGPFAFGGLANIIVPIQIGAPDMAFPRLNALSYWLYLMGSITMLMGFFTAGGAANFGWVAYAPLSNSINTPGAGADLWIGGLLLTGFSAIFTGVNLTATIFYLRAPGMTMFRMPIFTWNMLVTAILILLAFPVLDRRAHHALLRPTLRDPYLLSCRRRCSGAVATHLLVLGPSGGLYSRPAVLRHGDRDHRGLLQEARLRLQEHGLRHAQHRRVVAWVYGHTTCSPRVSCCSPSSRS